MTWRDSGRNLGEAIVEGSFAAFALTHNPLFHTIFFFLAPIAIVATPFLGGMTATGKDRIGLLGAPVAAIGFVNTLPATLTAPFVLHYSYLAYDPIQRATIVNTTLAVWVGLVAYSFVMVLVGIGLRNWRYAGMRRARLEATCPRA